MIGKRVLILAILTGLGAASARAAVTGTHNKPRIRPLGSGLAREFKVPREEVLKLHNRGLTWVEVRRVLAQKTGRPVREAGRKPGLKGRLGNRHSR